VPDIVELDASDPASLAELADQVREHWDSLDGLLHAIAFAPPDAIGGHFLETQAVDAELAFRVSAFSLKAVTSAVLPLLAAGRPGASVVALDLDASRAWPGYDWMGVAKAALEATTRYLACYLGPLGIRVNTLAVGPLVTTAAGGFPRFRQWTEPFASRAPLGWDIEDRAVAAGPARFLLSDASRGVTGTILHVDGGYGIRGEAIPDLPPVVVEDFERLVREEVPA
jgi:enoyl-[acyl-carrier-protein] reductase (NADH)